MTLTQNLHRKLFEKHQDTLVGKVWCDKEDVEGLFEQDQISNAHKNSSPKLGEALIHIGKVGSRNQSGGMLAMIRKADKNTITFRILRDYC
jgi:hypothetical protein